MADEPVAPLSGRRDSVLRTLQADQCLLQALDVLGDVDTLVLKGPATADLLHAGTLTSRTYRDVDLLLADSALDLAIVRLESAGFRRPTVRLRYRVARFEHATVLVNADGAQVDLHITVRNGDLLLAQAADPALVWRLASEGRETLRYMGRDIPVPSRPFRLLTIVLAVSLDELSARSPVANVALAIRRGTFAEWQAAAALATEIGVDDRFAAKLRLAGAEGAALAERLLPDRSVPLVYRCALRGLPTPFLVGAELASLSDWRERGRYVADRLFPVREGLSRDELSRWRRARWRRVLRGQTSVESKLSDR